ncbi:MAG: hypothetical protein LBI92_11990 [Azoarcus sp.]|jgi:hypothetical protein|nr:hypothetical protein [Azoarcus sp.]
MFPRRRSIALFLTILFFAIQAFWLVHRLEHDVGTDANSEAACEFCLSVHGMGSALLAAERVLARIIVTAAAPPAVFPALRDADPVQPRQQGPPKIS